MSPWLKTCDLRTLLVALVIPCVAMGQDPSRKVTDAAPDNQRSGVQFNRERLHQVPEIFATDDFSVEGVKSLYYRGLDYKGRATRVFAYYGTPPDAKDKKVPAMVLIHGGGGTAFANWVKLWNSRGYAAIAMDLCGCVPDGVYGNWKRHELGGPPGWDASFYQLNDPIEEQWTYQAVSAAVLANSLLRSFPEIEANRIGVTGISWGGYLTCIVSGVDERFRFACPVYGCGFLGDNSVWIPTLEKIGPEDSQKWLRQWDPSQYLRQARMPMLWVNGTNDFAYPMDSWKKSYLLPKGASTLCLRVRMPHGHGAAGENPAEIHHFANAVLNGGTPLPRITDQGISESGIWATFESAEPITKAELAYTCDTGKWSERKWEVLPADVDSATHRVQSSIPADAKVVYINVYDQRDCVVRTRHVER